MRLLEGVIGEIPNDEIIRGRVGARKWFIQSCSLLALGFLDVVVMLVLFFTIEIISLIVLFVITSLLITSFKICWYSWAWLGFDQQPPAIFDLKRDGIEVGTWKNGLLRRKKMSADALLDLRVYWAPLEYVLDSAWVNVAEPLQSTSVVQQKLPSSGDITFECFNSCWACCLSSRRDTRDLALVFLGATVRGDRRIMRLSRNVTRVSEVEQLLSLARAARQHVGLQEEIAATVLGAKMEDSEGVAAPSALRGSRGGAAAIPDEEQPVASHHDVRFQDPDDDVDEHPPNRDDSQVWREVSRNTSGSIGPGAHVEQRQTQESGEPERVPPRFEESATRSEVIPLPRVEVLAQPEPERISPPLAEASEQDSTVRVEQMDAHMSSAPRPKMKSKPRV